MNRRLCVMLVVLLAYPALALARDKIRMVGSALALSFAEPVAQRFSVHRGYPPPSMEITGSAVGFGQFCSGVGFEFPDVIATSRRMATSEFLACQLNGVDAITEIEVGLDGIALVRARKGGAEGSFSLTPGQIFGALARQVDSGGGLVPNTAAKWSDVDGALPAVPIEVMGPPPDSPAQYDFFELLMEEGCQAYPAIQALDEGHRYRVCRTPRRDGAFREGAKNERLIVDWLREHPSAFAILSFSMFDRDRDVLMASPIRGVLPSVETISEGRYRLATPIYLYVKNRHVESVPGLQEFLYEFTSERAISPAGYLAENDDAGFVPLNDMGRNRARDMALSLMPLDLATP